MNTPESARKRARTRVDVHALARRANNDIATNARAKKWIASVSNESLLALIYVAHAAKRVADERAGHELGGEHPLYVKLVTLDEALDALSFDPSPLHLADSKRPLSPAGEAHP